MLITVDEHACQNSCVHKEADEIHKEINKMRGQLEALKNDYNHVKIVILAYNQILVMMMIHPHTNMRNMIEGTSCLLPTAIKNMIYVLIMTHIMVD